VLPLPGLTLESVGNYLAALGLFSIAARAWPAVRSCWRNGAFALLNGPRDMAELVEQVSAFARDARWRPFEPSWKEAAKQTQKAGLGVLHRWRANEADEEMLLALDAHLVAARSRKTNPLLDSRGGKRVFHKGWRSATDELSKAAIESETETREDLSSVLLGGSSLHLAKQFNAASWFSAANKIYNHSPGDAYREGQVSAWSMAFCCEGFEFLAGSSSRRLALRSRPLAGFPFIVEGEAPEAENLCGKCIAEFWAPVWCRPMSDAELRALFAQGRVVLNGHGALTAAAFGGAILQRGTGSGLAEFRRFTLVETTSSKAFETRLASVVPTDQAGSSETGEALSRVVELRDRLPADKKVNGRWRFNGLRGPLDRALIELAEAPSPERACSVVDAMVAALRKVDRNRAHRAAKRPVQFQLLRGMWAASLLDDHGDSARPETRLALAIATLRPGVIVGAAKKRSVGPFLPYWLGVEAQDKRGRFWRFPEAVPFRRVWGAGSLPVNLAGVLHRRLVEETPEAEPPFGAWYRAGLGDIALWLRGEADEAELERWLLRFSLFDWEYAATANLKSLLGESEPVPQADGTLVLFGLFKPLFDGFLLKQLLPAGSRRKAAKAGPLPRLVAQLARGDISSAVELATNAYRAAGVTPANLPRDFAASDCARLLAALLIPVASRGLTAACRDSSERWIPLLSHRWLSPNKQNKDRT
jgi:CRISPR-associated protein Csx17